MSKKNLRKLLDRYNVAYEALYNAGSTGEDEDIEKFGVIAAMFPDILQQFNLERFDCISSDRECAAFAIAFRSLVAEQMAI